MKLCFRKLKEYEACWLRPILSSVFSSQAGRTVPWDTTFYTISVSLLIVPKLLQNTVNFLSALCGNFQVVCCVEMRFDCCLLLIFSFLLSSIVQCVSFCDCSSFVPGYLRLCSHWLDNNIEYSRCIANRPRRVWNMNQDRCWRLRKVRKESVEAWHRGKKNVSFIGQASVSVFMM